MLSFEEVCAAVQDEMAYQDIKWGADKQQSLPGYMVVMENELRKAREGWCANKSGRESALAEILQTVTVGIRCLEQYGITGWAVATDDLPNPPASNELSIRPNVKVVELTLVNGSSIFIAKAAFHRATTRRGFGATVFTNNGSFYDVQESALKIQQMMQD
jgi:hypothetical protein